MRKLEYTNPLGTSITHYNFGFLITALDGIEMTKLTVQEQRAPGQDGSTYIDGIFDPRVITVSGSITEPDLPTIFQQRSSAQAQLNPKLGPGVLTYTNDEGVYTTLAVVNNVSFPNKEFTNPFQEFQLQFYCCDPYWYDQSSQTLNFKLVTGGFTFPFTFPKTFGTWTGSTAQNALNDGDSKTPVILTITGPATNPKVLNKTTGEFVKCLISLNPNESLVINTKIGSKSVVKISSTGVMTNQSATLTADSTYWTLGVGDNYILFSDDTPNSKEACVISWYNRYVGK